MKFILTVFLVFLGFYWLTDTGVVTVNNTKARTVTQSLVDKFTGEKPSGIAEGELGNVNGEVNRLCSDLDDLSIRARRLREKLLSNVVTSTGSAKVHARR